MHPDSFQYQADDGTLLSNTVTVLINPPSAVNQTYQAPEDGTLVVPAGTGVLLGDSDPSGYHLQADVVTPPAYGSLTLNGDGSFIYVPDAGYSGPDSFTYVANDGVVDSQTATVSLNVVNMGPTISISPPSTPYTAGGSITYTLTYANASSVTLAAADITLNATGTASGTVSVSGSGLAYTVTIGSIGGNGTLGISIAAGTAVDSTGDLALAAGPSATFAVENTAPTISIWRSFRVDDGRRACRLHGDLRRP